MSGTDLGYAATRRVRSGAGDGAGGAESVARGRGGSRYQLHPEIKREDAEPQANLCQQCVFLDLVAQGTRAGLREELCSERH
eukprot:560412-Rhodomonas_salina.6